MLLKYTHYIFVIDLKKSIP